MTDALYFTPKTYVQESDWIPMLRMQLITLDDYDKMFGGHWSAEAISAASDLYRDGGCSFRTWRRVIFGVDDA